MRRRLNETAKIDMRNSVSVKRHTRRNNTLSHVQNFLTDDPLQRRWEYRWSAASAAWFAVLLVFLLGRIDWRIAVMVAAAAFMLARGGDMLDDVGETGEIQ
ncbi:MAG TPA: hypothetical protein VLB68_01310 [Pyrinomonadaceae bacterium]|nr:hypothetical protein [Pyrinomonadaceae bacterium]